MQHPQSPNVNKKVGIANGQIVVVSDNWDEIGRKLRQAEPNAGRQYCIAIGTDYGGVHEILQQSPDRPDPNRFHRPTRRLGSNTQTRR
jgi:hypothetical protein